MQPVKTIILFVSLFCYSSIVIAKSETLPQNFRQQSSLLFVENKGQITDQHGTVRNDIDFKLQAPGLTMFIGNGQLHYQWTKASPQPSPKEREMDEFNPNKQMPGPKQMGMPFPGDDLDEPAPVSTYRMDVVLIGANPNAVLEASEADAYYENHITKNTGEKGVVAHTYRKVTYKNIYPNIDWVLYVSSPVTSPSERQGEAVLKYDFIVHPGGNANDIKLRYDGATELKLHDGALTATTPYGSITENAPYTYRAETKQQVASAFVLDGNTLSFNVEHQVNSTLVIDPQLHWATYYGGSNHDYLWHVTGDDSGYVYATGQTLSANNIATTGAYQDTLPTVVLGNTIYYASFIVKFAGNGNRQWATYYYPGCFVRLHCGKYKDGLYLAGYADTSIPAVNGTTGTQQPIHGGGVYDGLLLKFTGDGMPVWMTYVGGAAHEYIYDLDIDGNGDIIVGGITHSSNNIASANAHQPTRSTSWYSGFLAKYTPQGLRKWGTYYGGTHWTYIVGVTTDKWNNIYICGGTDDTAGIATKGTHKDSAHFIPNSANGYWDEAFVAKFNDTGKRIWGTYYGGTGRDYLWNIDCDDTGYVYTTGWTESATDIATPGAYRTSLSSSTYAGMMVKFDSTGQRRWGTYLDSNYNSSYNNGGVSVFENTLYVSGTTANTTDIATPDAAQHYLKGTTDMYLMKFTTEGKKTWGTYFGGSGQEYSYGGYYGGGVYVNKQKGATNIYMTGTTWNSDDIATYNAHQFQRAGNYDGFLAKFTDDTLVSINSEIPLYACVGDTINVGYRTTYSFRQGNVFTVQLSDATGSFVNAVALNSIVDDTTGEMKCVIPLNTPRGDSYRIRVAASLRGDTSVESVNKLYINNIYPNDLALGSNSPVCLEDTIRLTATSVHQGVQYYWKGVNNFTDAGDNRFIANAAATHEGDYIVTANLYGCKTRDTVTVSTKPRPYTNIINHDAAALTTPCERDTLRLAATTGNPGTTYGWTGPDGFSSTTQNPYLEPAKLAQNGKYIVTATLNGCQHKDTATAVIKPLPQNFTATVTGAVCAGTDVHLNANSTSTGVTWKWNGPNSFTTTNRNFTILSAQPIHSGDYYIEATLNGCMIKDTVTAVVNSIPVKPVINSNSPICEMDSIRLSGSSATAGATYTWAGPQTFTGATGDTVFEAATTNASGSYTVTATKDGCSNNESVSITVKPLPVAVTLSSNSPVCEGGTLQLSSTTSTTGASYNWSGPNSFAATTQSTNITSATPIATGWYKMLVTLNGCSITDSTQATVHATPVITGTSANQPLCTGETLNLSLNSISNGVYSWSGPGGYTATTQQASRANMQFTDTGWYRVSVVANNCPSATDSVYVKANPVPFVTIFTAKDSICTGAAALFNAFANQHGGTPTYVWKINGQVATGSTTTFNTNLLQDKDIVTCEMTEYTKCAAPYTDASNGITMNVLQWMLPVANITATPSAPVKAGDPVQFKATPTNGGTLPKYQWKRNNANVQGATGASWSASTLNDNDEICVEMTSNYMCPQPATVKSNCITVRVLTGINDNTQQGSTLSLYPNPNSGRFILSGKVGNVHNEELQLEVLNKLGQVVYRDKATAKQGALHKDVQLSELPAGTYMLRLQGEEQQYTLRFTIAQ